jgi:hypothetical protein
MEESLIHGKPGFVIGGFGGAAAGFSRRTIRFFGV